MKIKPDVFIISGGGNDMLSDYRLSNFVRINPLSNYQTCKLDDIKHLDHQGNIDTSIMKPKNMQIDDHLNLVGCGQCF